ncbi:MAG: hypothetical protein CVV05_02080 [Gammaproteobacteria bacterium HGW-Gammaproteobacteria-1]|nr:MAG: hypothetical protein CVV05_02080 [Gammaproteobacteria bacterium HGW-Gammaproteobacteria-1]
MPGAELPLWHWLQRSPMSDVWVKSTMVQSELMWQLSQAARVCTCLAGAALACTDPPLLWQLAHCRGVPLNTPRTWQLLHSTLMWAPVSGKPVMK